MKFFTVWFPVVGTFVVALVNVFLGLKLQSNNAIFAEKMKEQSDEFEREMRNRNQEFEREMKKMDVDATLKAKTRIEWITEVRRLVSKYIVSLFEFCDLVAELGDLKKALKTLQEASPATLKTLKTLPGAPSNIGEGKIILSNEIEKKEKEAIIHKNRILSVYEQLSMHFSKQNDHNEIERVLNDPLEVVNETISTLDQQSAHTEQFYKKLMNKIEHDTSELKETFKEYLKKEWDKAKEGK